MTRLVAKASIPNLIGGAKPLRIRGADALSVPLGKTPDSLVADLDVLDEILGTPAAPELAVLEQLVPVKNPDVDMLEAGLEAEVDNEDPHLGLSWPLERIDENTPPTSFKFLGAGRRPPQDDVPELEHILEVVRKSEPGDRVERLRALRVQLFRDVDATDAMSKAIPALQWLAFETEIDGQRYCLHDGKWYVMNQGYAEKLKARTHDIFTRDSGIVLPAWPEGMAEQDYNDLAADSIGGVSLDRKLIYTEFHHRGIEACDVLAAERHVDPHQEVGLFRPCESPDRAVARFYRRPASRLGGEGQTPGEGRRGRRRPKHVPDRVARVVLGRARSGTPPTADSLFTFTQVTLVRGAQALQGRGVDVFIAPIERS